MVVDAADPQTIIAELQRQRDYFSQQVQIQNQANATLQAQFAAAAAANQDILRTAQKAARCQPEYHHDGKKSWTVFLAERSDWEMMYQIGRNVVPEEWHKNAVVAGLKGTAREMVTGQEDRLRALPWEQFQRELEAIFQPAAESELMRQEFKRKKQGADEDIIRYLSVKESLFRRAYGDPANNAEKTRTLLDSTIKGVFNQPVKERLMTRFHEFGNPIRDFTALRGHATNEVACERALFQQGLGRSTSLDGLRATATVSNGGSMFNTPSQVEPMDIGSVSAMGGGQNGRKCYNCDKPGHLARDCKSPRKRGSGGGGGGPGGPKKDRTDEECNRCGRKGHFKRDCYSKTDKKGKKLPPNDSYTGKVRTMPEDMDGVTEGGDSD